MHFWATQKLLSLAGNPQKFKKCISGRRKNFFRRRKCTKVQENAFPGDEKTFFVAGNPQKFKKMHFRATKNSCPSPEIHQSSTKCISGRRKNSFRSPEIHQSSKKCIPGRRKNFFSSPEMHKSSVGTPPPCGSVFCCRLPCNSPLPGQQSLQFCNGFPKCSAQWLWAPPPISHSIVIVSVGPLHSYS